MMNVQAARADDVDDARDDKGWIGEQREGVEWEAVSGELEVVETAKSKPENFLSSFFTSRWPGARRRA